MIPSSCLVLALAPAAADEPGPSQAAIDRQSNVDLSNEPKRRRGRYLPPGSKQRFALEIKAGPYTPDVDAGYTGPGFGPYAEIFGETNDAGIVTGAPNPRVMIALGFEWQFVYLAGPFFIGTQIGIMWDRADAPFVNPPDEATRSAADRVEFGMVPIALQVGYRFELLADRYSIPIVPYAKFGPVYSFWWSLDGSRNISVNGLGQRGSGGVWGYQLNAGGMLRLDFIEPGAAKKLDQYTGINHTYLFGELQLSVIDNFGIGNSISLGDTTGFAGFAVEF